MNNLDRTGGIAKLLVITLVAVAANVPAHGVSAAEPQRKATCSAPDHLANLREVFEPEYPSILKNEGVTGSTLVQVSLARSGAIQSATVAKTSGYFALDQEALSSALASKYAPETVSCRPVAGEYFVNVTFE